jgi:hypothetical protein
MDNEEDLETLNRYTLTIRGRKIIIENLAPELPEDEKPMRRKKIGDRLYELFSKY